MNWVMRWRARRPSGLKMSALVLLAVPGIVALATVTTLADSSPSPNGSPPSALPGDPTKGGALYAANCSSCHGVNLEGGIGAVLNPIDKLPGVPNTLDPTFLIAIITSGRQPQAGDPKSVAMPPKGGNNNLSDQDVKDLAAFIIQQNSISPSNRPLTPGEAAISTIMWVGIGIIVMVFLTYLLAQYNMRWIARRAAARRK